MTEQLWSGALFYDRVSDRVLLQLRDEHAPRKPNMWGLFGGTAEEGEAVAP
jgi:hypothetical protein